MCFNLAPRLVGILFDARLVSMPRRFLAQSYRDRAKECFELARTAPDAWSKKALEDLGHELLETAEDFQPSDTKDRAGRAVTSNRR